MEQQKRLTPMKIGVGAFCFLGKMRQPKTNRSVLLKILSRLFGGKMEKSFILCGRRIATMRERLGKACDLIDNEQWLGVFRNRQINHEKEFNQSVKMVKSMKKTGKIKNASHYFAKIWKKENINKTLKIVREFLNRQVSKLAEKREDKRKNEEINQFERDFNSAGYAKFQQMKKRFAKLQ